MGLGAIMKSKVILLVVSGSSKADMIKRALKGPITTQVPASLLQTHPNLIVMLDQEAGEELMKNDNIKAD
jgi:glucosamine-6-phosphate deaminase